VRWKRERVAWTLAAAPVLGFSLTASTASPAASRACVVIHSTSISNARYTLYLHGHRRSCWSYHPFQPDSVAHRYLAHSPALHRPSSDGTVRVHSKSHFFLTPKEERTLFSPLCSVGPSRNRPTTSHLHLHQSFHNNKIKLSMSIQLGAPTLGGVVNGEQHELPPVTSYTTVTPGQPATFDSRVVDVQPVQVQQQPQQVVYSEQPQSQPQIQPQPQVVESATIVQTQPVPVHAQADGDEMARTSSVKFDNPHSQPDSLRAAEVRRDRAGSTATTRSTATTATTTTGTSSIGGTTGDGEDCVKDKRVKEWNKHFEVEQGEGVVCSEFFFWGVL
jgi:hypothetical protein